MYPDNYMNPMNNPMTNPNYGYNRMQQVQQMQRAINPQVPNMFGQVEQPQQMQSFISAVPVTCLEEAKAARIALDGSMSVFVNIQDGEIYTKQLSMNGLAELKTYKLVNPLALYKWVCVKDSTRLMLQSQKVALPHSNAAAKLIAILMLFVQKTTRTLVKSLLQFMQKLKQLVL